MRLVTVTILSMSLAAVSAVALTVAGPSLAITGSSDRACAQEVRQVLNRSAASAHRLTEVTNADRAATTVTVSQPGVGYHLTSLVDGVAEREFVVVGQDAWERDGAAQAWRELPKVQAFSAAAAFTQPGSWAIDAMADPTCNGPELIGTSQVLAYHFVTPSFGGTESWTIHADPETGRALSIETAVTGGAKTAWTYEYDTTLSVLPPAASGV